MIFTIDKKDLTWVQELVQMSECILIKTEWENKQSSMRYDFEPFDSTEFNVNLHIDGSSQHLKFLQYLINARKGCNWFFELCLNS